MKKITVVISVIALTVISCGPEKTPSPQNQSDIAKTFFERSITYTLHPQAKEYMSKVENLLSQVKQIKPPLSDNIVLPLYRDADANRDHHITAPEATAFYHDYVLQFEDSLGSVSIK